MEKETYTYSDTMGKSSNPSIKGMSKYVVGTDNAKALNLATYAGVGWKILIYCLMAVVSGVLSAVLLINTSSNLLIGLLIGAPLIALVCGIVASLSPRVTAIFGSIYCIMYGLLIGAISAILEAEFGGIALSALLCTVVITGVMAVLYYSGTVRVGSKFRKFVFGAILAIIVSQLLFLVLSFAVPGLFAFYFDSFWLQLIICVAITLIAAITLLIDFDNITRLVEAGVEKKLEWRAAFGLMVTLIWLYLQILRILLIIFSKRR